MEKNIPNFLIDLLEKQYSKEDIDKITKGLLSDKKTTLRINTIKSNKEEICNALKKENIEYSNVDWNDNALIIENSSSNKLKELEIYNEGKIYLQSLSSMIPPIILAPKEKENIFDMAAAPGGKTTQIAALGNNKVMITACEKNKIRGERLKYNLEKQGVKCVNIMLQDARTLSDYFSFDKILLDSPCSRKWNWRCI